MSVSVTASASTVDGTDTATLTATVANDKNSAGVTWSVSGGGSLSNTTTTSATYTAPAAGSTALTVTVTATSVADTSQTQSVTITVPAKPTVTTTSTNLAGTVGTAFSVTLQGGGGIPPYKNWAVSNTGSALPTCLTLSSAGVLTTATGMAPTASCAGTYTNLIFTFADSGTPTPLTGTSSPLTLTIITAPAILFPTTLASGTVGTGYSGSVTASGGAGALTYSLAGGALPPDLTLNTATGVITGTPKAADVGTATFKVSAADAYGDTATSGTLSITIAAAPAITFTGTMPATGTYNAIYAGSAAATGGAGTLTYSLAGGALPPDLSLNASTGAVAGTPSKAADVGTFNFTVKAADAYGDSNTQAYALVVSYPAVTITPGAGSLPLAVMGQAYSQALTAAGGSGSGYTWTVTGLPANGLSFSASGATLTISGTAAATGTINFTASATDGAGDSIGPFSYSIQVYSPVTLPAAIPASLPSTATVNVAYSGTVVASGGSGNYAWTVTGLSDGLSSTSSGGTLTISGTPTSAATVTANVSVKDTTTNVTAGPYAYTITVYNTVTLPSTNPSTLGPAIVSTAYTGTIVAAGGSGDYSWTITGLPSDSLNYSTSGGTLTISGTPATATTVTFTAKVTDNTTSLSSGPYTYTVTVYNAVTLNSTGLPSTATVNTAYSGTITASGGSGSGYVWTVTGLFDGLTYSANGATLTINGTPTAAATVSFTVSVKDSVGNSAGPTNYTINAYNALTLPSPNPSTLGPASINLAYTGTIVASGGSGDYSWTVTGLPSDSLNYSANGGTLTISGTPGTATTVTFTAKVTDTTTNISAGPYTYTVTVYSGLTLPSPNPSTLGSAGAGSSYTGTIIAAGGSGNYSWTVTGFPSDGLNYATNGGTLTITGTPTSAQTVQFTAKVTDTSSNQTAGPFNYSITVYGALALPAPNPSSLPSNGYTNVNYGGSINASGGSGNYSWSVSGLPSDGLSFAGTTGSTLTILGLPTAAQTVTFGVTLTDTTTNATLTQNGYNITISNPTPVLLPASNPSSLGPATVNQNYNGAINASGGVPPYTWAINGNAVGSSGYSLGNGTLVASNTGGNTLSIYGTPSTAGTVALTNVMVTDSQSPTTSDTKSYSLTVSPVSTLQVTVNQVPQGMVNMPYTFNYLSVTGGVGPYTLTYTNAPAGLSQQSGTWNLVGTPTSSGSTTVTVKVTDSSTPTAQQQTTTFTLPVVPQTVAANNGELKGQYACYVEKYWDGGVTGGGGKTLYRGGLVFAFAADGNGTITGGEVDSNSPKSGYKSASTNGALGGTYAVGSDNRGYILLTAGGSSNGAFVLALAGGNLDTSSRFSEFAIVAMDDAGATPSNQTGSGHCYEQNTTGLSGITLSGGYVFGFRGEDMQGNLEAQAGSAQYSGGTVSGVLDIVDAGTYQGPISFTGTNTTTDAYGRMTVTAGPAGQTANTSVWYLTNNSSGESVGMSANPHNAASDADFLIGESRAQVAAHVAASYPFNGPSVLYTSGLDSDVTSYNAQVAQITGSSSAASINVNEVIENNSGTLKTQSPGTMGYTTSTPSGRTTLSGQSGIVFYIYDTNSAVVLFGDAGNGGGTTTENQLGWLLPQTAPGSGKWAIGGLTTSYFMSTVQNGDYSKDFNSGSFRVDSSGNMLNFAQDDGEQSWADWDEPLSGSSTVTATGIIAPDTTYDPNGTLGIFDVNVTEGGTTTTQVYCLAISVDKATNSSTQGRLACLDATSKSPQITIVAE